MKLSFVGAVLLISVLGTDAQGYAGSQSYSVSTNYNPQPADPNNIPNLLPPLPPPPPGYSGYSVSTNYNSQRPEPRPYNFPASAEVSYPRPEGNTGYRVDTYFGNHNQQYPPPPPPPPPSSSFLSNMLSTIASYAQKPISMVNDMMGTFTDLLGGLSQPSKRSYPLKNQASYHRPVPVASSQVFVSSYPSHSASNQVGVPPGPYNGLPPLPPPPPPPFVSQVTSSSDSNSGPPPANSQTYNVRVPAPPQNAM
ncbi:uncharacterized protein LOC117669243 isoform X2 [Pantherophis guttatus]|uniref:Uncharacterized protein LOC117669243 isoform X2 n=1 Tax=Pantherophis guttatus TaxID=94885 RepID=A0ABM3ZNH3_PANGU|nr:uncharacterized protein LOC117669243 isoform X2 [Pantherophis guttatus]